MADEQGAVIIRDDAGTEHEFPAGFDPQRAAAIVRGHPYQPRNVLAEGRASAATSGAPEGTEPSGLAQLLGPLAHPQTLTDFARLLTLPVDSVKKAIAAAVSARVAPPVTGGALSATGRGVEHLGTELEGSAKMIGAADVLTSHKPIRAIALAAAPAALKATGRGLQRAGAALATPRAAAMEAATAEAAPAAAVPTEFEAARAARAAANTLPDQRALNDAALAARRAAYQAGQQTLPPAGPVVKASGKMQLTAPEMKEFTRLITKKVPLADALEQVTAMRELAARLGGQTSAEVAAEIAARVGNKSPVR